MVGPGSRLVASGVADILRAPLMRMAAVDFLEPVRAFLACPTPDRWVEGALSDIPLLLQDHANCEKKAAGTAMNLLFRYSERRELQVLLAQLV